MTINFTHNENIKGIYFSISQGSETEPAKLKALMQGLEATETKFRNLKINLPLSNLVKRIIVVKGKKEKSFITNLYQYYEVWKAFFVKQQDAIVFDLNMFNNSYEILDTLVHELGHAVHVKFITPDAEEYSSSISKKYVEIIHILGTLKNDIEVFYSDEEMQEEFKKEALDYFNGFLMTLKSSVDHQNFEKNEVPFSKLAKLIHDKFISSNNFTCLQAVESMINAIMEYIPSESGLINEYEYFAECFRMFILEPENLSLNNRNMVINTLTMSRAQGKELMQAHKLIKYYVNQILS